MTSFLRLNGIAVPVQLGTADTAQDDIGSSHRAEDGTPIFNRRTTKRRWSGRTTPRSAAEALAWRDLVTGKGHVLNWEANNHYTSKGLAPTLVGANFTIANTTAKFGTYRAASAAAANNLATWPMFTSTSPWTVALWVSDDAGATWHHNVHTSLGGKWFDGVTIGSSFTYYSVSGGVLTLGDPAQITAYSFDDVVAFPQVMPSTWPGQLYAFGSPFGALPRLTSDGLFVEQNAQVSVKGGAGKLHLIKGTVPGSAQAANLHDFEFELMEA